MNIQKILKNIFFPAVCVSCKTDCGQWLCQKCRQYLELHIQKQNYRDIQIPIYTIYKNKPIIRSLIHCFKYRFYTEISEIFKADMSISLEEIFHGKSIVCVPSPMHRRKKLQRGFNQCEKILSAKYKILKIHKTRHTKSQMSLSKEARQRNVVDAFMCKETLDSDVQYVIIDDIVTTGSTIQALATTLHHKGARHVSAVCLSRGT